MKTPKVTEPLWVIEFDHTLEGKTLKEKALFCISISNLAKAENFNADEKFALEFLARITDSFKEITEPFLKEADAMEKPEADEIREKFKSLDLWIKWLRRWQDGKSDSDEEKRT